MFKARIEHSDPVNVQTGTLALEHCKITKGNRTFYTHCPGPTGTFTRHIVQVGKYIEKSSTFIALSAASASQSKAKFIQTPAISISFLII
jgi:hypothetical protein